MRVAFLSWRDLTHPDAGGSEVYVEEVAAGLARRGHQVTIVCARHPGSPASSTRDGVRIVRRGGRLSVYVWGLLHLLGPAGRRYDVVVDVINGLPFLAPLVRRRGVVALVHHLHREQWRLIYPGLRGRLGWFVESGVVPLVYRRRTVITVSEASRAALASIGFDPDRVRVVHNGTPALPPPHGGRSRTPRLVMLARLVPHKQVETAVDVLAALAPRHPDLRLDIVGEGWWAPSIDRHIADSGVADRVTRHGWVDEQTKADLLAHAWVALLPSVTEGWGIAVMEAAAVGTPTAVFAQAGGTTESVLDAVTGIVALDTEDLVERVHRLLEDTSERARMGRAARDRATTFTWEAATAQCERLLAAAAQEP